MRDEAVNGRFDEVDMNITPEGRVRKLTGRHSQSP